MIVGRKIIILGKNTNKQKHKTYFLGAMVEFQGKKHTNKHAILVRQNIGIPGKDTQKHTPIHSSQTQ